MSAAMKLDRRRVPALTASAVTAPAIIGRAVAYRTAAADVLQEAAQAAR